MQRVKLTVEYHGAPFAGWQRQPNVMTVQQALEEAAAQLDGAPVQVRGAGRTDAGVHASGQVADMDLSVTRPIRKIADAMNHYLRPHPVAVLKAEAVAGDFSARFDATARAYRYIIINRRADLALQQGLAWRMPMALDAEAMQQAAKALIGAHDFTTFRDLACQATSPMRTLDRLDVSRQGDIIHVTAQARSFLHRQVRSIVGSLVDVGRGKQTVAWMADILQARDRKLCGQVAPAEGLYLERVDYA